MKKIILAITLMLFTASAAFSQLEKPIKWAYGAKRLNANEVEIQLKATLEDGWHLYSQNLKPNGPQKTTITFKPSPEYKTVGKTTEPQGITIYDKNFKMNVTYFAKSVIFKQKLALKGNTATVKGTIEFAVCDESKCLPPDEVNFTIAVK